MSVWFKYSGDKDITTGHPGGASVFAPTGAPPSVPPYGTILSTGSSEYQIGGTAYSNILASFVYTQTCIVNTVADGSGGSFIDWSSATSINFKPNGESIAVAPSTPMDWGNLEVPTDSGDYYHNYTSDGYEEVHSGAGTIAYIPNGYNHWYTFGHIYGSGYDVDSTTEVPSSSSSYYPNGTLYHYNYIADGDGGYIDSYSYTYGSFYSNGTEVSSSLRFNVVANQTEVPSSSMMYWNNGTNTYDTYVWDGSGGYSTSTGNTSGSYISAGVFITNDGMYDYYWDGSGGYYYI